MNPLILFLSFPNDLTDTWDNLFEESLSPSWQQAKRPGELCPAENPARSAAVEHFGNRAFVVSPIENLTESELEGNSFSRFEHKMNIISGVEQ